MKLTELNLRLSRIDPGTAVPATLQFLDTIGTFSHRGSFYNALSELEDVAAHAHLAMFGIDRGLYAVMSAHPGATDYSRQVSVGTMLSNPRGEQVPSMLTAGEEYIALSAISGSLPYHRMLNCFIALQENRVNNSRTRRLILSTVLNDKALVWHSVKYRKKLRAVLTHAYGERMVHILGSILAKSMLALTHKESNILRTALHYYDGLGAELVCECLSFIFGNDNSTHPMHVAFYAAREDLGAGKILPPEVLEGIRSMYHPEVSDAIVMTLTKDRMTSGQKIVLQSAAEKKGVKVAFNPGSYDPTKLYIYLFERYDSIDLEEATKIEEALERKAEEAAAAIPLRLGRIGIVVDNSASMEGHGTQKYRPIARALAMRDMFQAASDGPAILKYTNPGAYELVVEPSGDSHLALPMLDTIREGAESVVIISDGYENAPAGRTAEVVEQLKRIDGAVPIYQVSPVMSAEAGGAKRLSDNIAMLPVGDNMKSFGLGMARILLENDFARGVQAMIGISVPQLLEG